LQAAIRQIVAAAPSRTWTQSFLVLSTPANEMVEAVTSEDVAEASRLSKHDYRTATEDTP